MPFNLSKEEFEKLFNELYYPTLEYRSLPKDYSYAKNVNSEICSKCGGKCCKMCGCHFSPDDFEEISFESLKKEIEKGYISIDLVDGELIYSEINVYILRARNVNSPIVDYDYGERGQCILLTESGCKLDYENRPSGGKLLVPREATKCHQNYTIKNCCYEWLPHKKILKNLADYFEDKDFPCSL